MEPADIPLPPAFVASEASRLRRLAERREKATTRPVEKRDRVIYQTHPLDKTYLVVTLVVDGTPTARLHGKPGSTPEVFTGPDALDQAKRRHVEQVAQDIADAEPDEIYPVTPAGAAAAAHAKALHYAERIKTLPERHKVFVEGHGKVYKGIGPWTGWKGYRVTHCYNCVSHLESADNFECLTCGWLICSECASCGCGFKR